MRRPSLSILTWYSQQLDRRPLLTKGVTSGLIGASGDCICQYLHSTTSIVTYEAGKKNGALQSHDWHRTGRFFIMGAFWVAPVTNSWYTTLATRLIPGKTSVSTVSKRLVLDQFVFAPLFCPSFLGLLWFLEGLNISRILTKLREVAPSIIVASWSLWIPAMAVNFSVVPLKFQVLFGNIVALLWNIYLSYISTLGSEDVG
jgi:peroxisomal membrane protein 2